MQVDCVMLNVEGVFGTNVHTKSESHILIISIIWRMMMAKEIGTKLVCVRHRIYFQHEFLSTNGCCFFGAQTVHNCSILFVYFRFFGVTRKQSHFSTEQIIIMRQQRNFVVIDAKTNLIHISENCPL